jgi:hypothetical protein
MSTFDAAAAYRSWCNTMLDNQRLAAAALPGSRGIIAPVVPADAPAAPTTDASWSSALVEIVSQSVTTYGDLALLERAYDGARAWFLFLVNQTDPRAKIMYNMNVWGDWDAQFDRAVYVPVTAPICATSSMVRVAQALAAWAQRAGRAADVPEYEAFLASAQPAYNAYYGNAAGTYADGIEQTSSAVMPLAIGFVPAPAEAAVGAWLIHDVETTRGGHLMTGSSGTRHLFHVLSSLGRTDLALAVAAAATFPSHGWWLTQGATTCWENWSGVNDTTHPPPPTHNHIFLCSTSGWVLQRLLGVRPRPAPGGGRAAGYEFGLLLAPPLVDSLPAMAGTVATPLGAVALAWAWAGAPMASTYAANVSLPPGAAAALALPVPGLANATVSEGGVPVFADGAFVPGRPGVVGAAYSAADGTVTLELLPGDYAFATAAAALHRVSACAAPRSALRPDCPPRTAAAHVTRAGVMRAGQRDDAHDGRHRFLAAHAVERLCRAHMPGRCAITWEALAEAAPQIDVREGERLCATFLCNPLAQ